MIGNGVTQRVDGLPVRGIILTEFAFRKVGRIEKFFPKLGLDRCGPLLRGVNGRGNLAPVLKINGVAPRRSRQMPVEAKFCLQLFALHPDLFAHQADIGALGGQHLMPGFNRRVSLVQVLGLVQ